MGMQSSIERTLAQMVERIVKRFAPERIILFGSHAAGNAGPDSDVDLLVVMTSKRSKAEQELDILKLLRSHRIPKDVIVTTPEDFAWRRKIPGTIERPAALGGRVLYAKP
jgi:predicted nucleotidyltransferase